MRFFEYKKPIIAGLFFSVTVIGVSLTYGAFNYIISVNTASSGSTLSSSEWNKVVSNLSALDSQLATVVNTTIPTGAVMAFSLTSCPGGWNPADGTSGRPDLRGQFIRWLNTFDGGVTTRSDGSQDPDCASRSGWCTIWSKQADEIKSHSHGWVFAPSGSTLGDYRQTNYSSMNGATNAFGGNETRPKNIALIYCIKN